ncbi:MAG: glycosyltransferase family 4 protein [candidate division NC10 bacterium]|nr:glycosyltransferase family 4 protein [candidate division NC10 bacterium]
MSRVLIVADAFPPALGMGVQRTLGFVRYLRDYGWEPVVLTARDKSRIGWDPELCSRVPPDTSVIRTYWFNPRLVGKRLYMVLKGHQRPGTKEDLILGPMASNGTTNTLRRWMHTWLLMPDEAIGWLPFAVRPGLRAIKTHRVKAIFSTSPSPVAHLIALILKRVTGLPWVADFRDLWTQSPYADRRQAYSLRWRYASERWLERQVLISADRIVTVSEPLRAMLLGATPNPDPMRFHVITNGYDPAVIEGLQREPLSKFTITYTGKFYGRSPIPFFQALSALFEAGAIEREDFRVRIVGISAQEVAEAVDEYGLGKVVRILEQVPHAQALQEQLNASALLLVVGPFQVEGTLTGKVFEYLAASRPILGMVPQDSAVADLLRRSQAGIIVNPIDPGAIGSAILDLYREFKATGHVQWRGNETVIQEYARPKLTARLAAVLDNLVQHDAGARLRQHVSGEAST